MNSPHETARLPRFAPPTHNSEGTPKSMTATEDIYAGTSETSEGRVFTITGQDWDQIAQSVAEEADERVVVNMGPQHPSTHGVLRLILELEG